MSQMCHSRRFSGGRESAYPHIPDIVAHRPFDVKWQEDIATAFRTPSQGLHSFNESTP